MTTVQKIKTCLWFDTNAEEAANFYISLFPDARISNVSYYGKDQPMPEGLVLTVDFELAGQQFLALNAGPNVTFTEAISMMVACDSQAEIDHYWDALTDGGAPIQCGWLKDKFGLTWQVYPSAMNDMLQDGTSEQASRFMQAMMKMVKLDIAELQRAYNG